MVSPNIYDNHQLCFASEKAFAVFTIDVEQGQMQAIGIIATRRNSHGFEEKKERFCPPFRIYSQ